MANLNDAIQALADAHRRHQLQGVFAPAQQPWPATLPDSAALSAFYAQHAPQNVKIDTGMSPIRLLNLAALEPGQRGYRWQDGTCGRREALHWNPAHLVFADDFGGGKPVIADTASKDTSVWASNDTGGPFQIAASLADFLAALAVHIDIVYGGFAVFEVLADDDTVKPDFLQQMHSRLAPVLGEVLFGAYVDYFYA